MKRQKMNKEEFKEVISRDATLGSGFAISGLALISILYAQANVLGLKTWDANTVRIAAIGIIVWGIGLIFLIQALILRLKLGLPLFNIYIRSCFLKTFF